MVREKKVSGSQERARVKAGIDGNPFKKKYRGNPQEVSSSQSASMQQEVMEENDYCGNRSINHKHRVTEKASTSSSTKKNDKKKKKQKKQDAYEEKFGDEPWAQ